MNMSLWESALIVKERQDAFLRGEMPVWEIEYLKKEYPNAIPDWLRLKANLQVRIRKFRKQLLTVIRVSLRKANGSKRFAPRDERSTLSKQDKRINKLKRQYKKSGCAVLLSWSDLEDEVKGAAFCL